jgi:nitroreductase
MILDLLRERFSVRSFRTTPVPENVLNEMLEAGRLAPSGGNEQAWCFGVITDKQMIANVSQAAYHQDWIASAPLLIVLCTHEIQEAFWEGVQQQRFPDLTDALSSMDRKLFSALNSEEHQTKIPGAYMTCVALEYDIGCTWVSRFNVDRVARVIEVPSGYFPSEILVFGYLDGAGTQAAKKPLEEVVFYRC